MPTNLLPATEGNIASATDVAACDTTQANSLLLQLVSGTFVGINVTFEATIDEVTWFAIQAIRTNSNTVELTSGVLAAAPAYAWRLPIYCFRKIRVRATAWTSGSAKFRFQPSLAEAEPLPGVPASAVTASGVAAHAATISGNPVRIGARALNANYAAVTTGQTADLVTTLVGALIEKPYSIPEQDWNSVAGASGIVNTTVAVTIKAAAGAGIRNYITGLDLAADTLGGATEVVIRDGAAGTVIWRTKLQTAGAPQPINIQFVNPIKSTANTLLEVATLTAVTGGVYVNARGYTAP